MRTVGIIAEYNPFHNGHAYQIQKAKTTVQADFAVVVMSPDFVQRGEPALVDKYSRTKMALENGADLVIELPICYATGSAEYFAEGGISLLHGLGCVDALSFGCEHADTSVFSSLADILLQEPEDYRQNLLQFQKQGMTFPKAREAALIHYLDTCPKFLLSSPSVSISDFLSSPNNILGLEYTKALKKINSPITVLPVKRLGSGYHSLDFNTEFCSASAVRAKLFDAFSRKNRFSTTATLSDNFDTAIKGLPADVFTELAPYLPESALSLLQAKFFSPNHSSGSIANLEAFSSLLHYKLLSEAACGFEKYLDVTVDLSDRIIKLLPQYESPAQFITLVKTKQMTEARIRRALLHILLNITQEATESYRQQGTVFYARVLGFRKNSTPLLHEIKKSSSIPPITKLADAKKNLSSTAMQMLTQDIYASHIYQLGYTGAHIQPLRNEYTCSPIIL